MRPVERYAPMGQSDVRLNLRVDEEMTLAIETKQHRLLQETLVGKWFSDYPYSLSTKSHVSYTVTLLEVA